MIELSSKYDCCGCEACVEACPVKCISFREDAEGFLYPAVDESACIGCKLCNRVCPVLSRGEEQLPLEVYAARNRSETDLLHGSSGGVFAALARKVLSRPGGRVFGAQFGPGFMSVEHTAVGKEEDLPALFGSKYLQSRIGPCYEEVRSCLDEGREVLFCGTGCQVLALKRFLRKDYPSLLTVEVVCHGVPSPKVWRRYLEEAVPGGGTLDSVSFRDKRSGWSTYHLTLSGSSSPEKGSPAWEDSRSVEDNPYMWLFLNNYSIRPSCFQCPAKSGRSQSDITLADYWGIEEAHPDFYDERGVGLLLVRTGKGKEFLSSGVDLEMKVSSLEAATRENPAYHSSPVEPAGREAFFRRFLKGKAPLEKLARRYRRRKAWAGIPGYVKRKLKAVKKKLL